MLFVLAAAVFCQDHSSDSWRLMTSKKQSAALLVDIPNYTCLESIGQSLVTPTGRMIDIDLLRVDVAISGRKEMYAWANSRKFSDRSLASTLNNGFSTTGIFSSLARSLAPMDSPRIEFLDEESLGDERTYRYAFHVPSDAGAWQIQAILRTVARLVELAKKASSGSAQGI